MATIKYEREAKRRPFSTAPSQLTEQKTKLNYNKFKEKVVAGVQYNNFYNIYKTDYKKKKKRRRRTSRRGVTYPFYYLLPSSYYYYVQRPFKSALCWILNVMNINSPGWLMLECWLLRYLIHGRLFFLPSQFKRG